VTHGAVWEWEKDQQLVPFGSSQCFPAVPVLGTLLYVSKKCCLLCILSNALLGPDADAHTYVHSDHVT